MGNTWLTEDVVGKAFSILYPYSSQAALSKRATYGPEVVTRIPRYPKNSQITIPEDPTE